MPHFAYTAVAVSGIGEAVLLLWEQTLTQLIRISPRLVPKKSNAKICASESTRERTSGVELNAEDADTTAERDSDPAIKISESHHYNHPAQDGRGSRIFNTFLPLSGCVSPTSESNEQ